MQQLDQDLQETIAKLNQIQQSVYELYEKLFFGANRHREQYLEMIRPVLDRDVNALNPIERSILLMAMHELSAMPETPYKVVINEAIELTKTFGGTDSHKYVNGILDKLVDVLRPNEPKGKPVKRSKLNKK
ncbi:MAG: transcription antitermination factor NusB [Neisseriaceae bacterium]|nr:transcription antitermination factor NusB [Neisseriaceae bacterium]